MADITGEQLVEMIMALPPEKRKLKVVTSDDPEDGFNFRAHGVKVMRAHPDFAHLIEEGEEFKEWEDDVPEDQRDVDVLNPGPDLSIPAEDVIVIV